MSGYKRNKKVYEITYTNIKWWHMRKCHSEMVTGCAFCEYINKKIAIADLVQYLKKCGFNILDFGNAHIVLDAPSMPFRLWNGMAVTKEATDLYNFIINNNPLS